MPDQPTPVPRHGRRCAGRPFFHRSRPTGRARPDRHNPFLSAPIPAHARAAGFPTARNGRDHDRGRARTCTDYKQKTLLCAIIGAMSFMHMTALADRIDRLNAAIGRAAAWLVLVVVLLQFGLVVARYLFGLGSARLTEAVIYAHAAVFMLAAAWTLHAGGHVRVDVFYAEASPRTKRWIDLAGAIVL